MNNNPRHLGNQPAFPVVINDNHEEHWPGLTKREEFAKAAMQGIKSNPELCRICSDVPGKTQAQAIANMAVQDADALLAELARME